MLPLCQYCKKNRVKRREHKFCSTKCYTDSGHRKIVGKINGPKWAQNYWKRFDDVFYRKYGHLDRVEQTKLLIKIGQRMTYKDEYKKKIEKLRELGVIR